MENKRPGNDVQKDLEGTGTDPKITGFYAGTLSLAEIGLGSLLHGLKIPLTGTFLSINQALFLTRLVKLNRNQPDARTLPFQVSNITALLKSLSPAGKKLLPMLAIASQGLLFTLGTIIFGANLIGCLIGAGLLAVWGVFQPLAILWLVYGFALGQEQMAKVFAYYSKLLSGIVIITPAMMVQAVAIFVVAKSFVSMAVSFAGWHSNVNEQQLLNDRLVKLGLKGLKSLPDVTTLRGTANPAPRANFMAGFMIAMRGALNDIRRPLFLLPLAMTGIFFWFAEDDLAPVIWGIFRPLAFGYLLFLAIRVFPIEVWIKRAGLSGTALESGLIYAIEVINGRKPKP